MRRRLFKSNAAIQVTTDYACAIGSADFNDADGDPEAGSLFRWLKNGSIVISTTQPVSDSLSLHLVVFAGGQAVVALRVALRPASQLEGSR